MKLIINDLIQKVNSLTNKIELNAINKLESNIVINNEDKNLVNSWIYPNKNIKYTRLYRASLDGDKISDFHRLSDDKGSILLIGITPNNYIFGGFTYSKLEKNNGKLADPNAFIFSLKEKKNFKTTNPKYFLHNYIYEGPIFWADNYAIEISNNILLNQKHYSNPINSYWTNLNLTESKYFSFIELEIFLVDIDK